MAESRDLVGHDCSLPLVETAAENFPSVRRVIARHSGLKKEKGNEKEGEEETATLREG